MEEINICFSSFVNQITTNSKKIYNPININLLQVYGDEGKGKSVYLKKGSYIMPVQYANQSNGCDAPIRDIYVFSSAIDNDFNDKNFINICGCFNKDYKNWCMESNFGLPFWTYVETYTNNKFGFILEQDLYLGEFKDTITITLAGRTNPYYIPASYEPYRFNFFQDRIYDDIHTLNFTYGFPIAKSTGGKLYYNILDYSFNLTIFLK